MTSTTNKTWRDSPDDPFGIPESVPSLSFDQVPPGTVKGGTVISIETDVQGRDYKTGEPATWEKSGQPKLSIVITLDTDDGERAFWVTKYSKNAKFLAIAAAQQAAGKRLEAGDVLKIQYTGTDSATDAKQYRAKIEPGKPSTAGDPFAAKQDEQPPF